MTTEAKERAPATEVEQLRQRVQALEEHLRALSEFVQRYASSRPTDLGPGDEEPRERPVPGWEHLVTRKHPWRRQLYLKGRNMTVRQLVGTVKANEWDPAEAARNVDLPVEGILEALRYAEENKELLNFEAAYERLILAQEGCPAASGGPRLT
jgi:hypothetical protein